MSKLVVPILGFSLLFPQNYDGRQFSSAAQMVSNLSFDPVSRLKHLFLSSPVNSYTPAMAKITKKNISTSIVSLKSGSELIKA